MKNKMKKILVFMGVVAIVIGGHVYSKQSSVKMSSLMLENDVFFNVGEYRSVSGFRN